MARPFLSLFALAIVVLGSFALPATGADRPNIVLFVADDLGWSDTGPYGNKVVRTPNLDALAKESLRFTRAFAGSPTCVPSRAVFFTGMMPFRNGAHANHSVCKAGVRSLPHYFQELGYRVALAGKTHIRPNAVFPFEQVVRSNVPEPGYEKKPGLRMDLGTAAVEQWIAKQTPDKPFALAVCDHSPHVIWPEKAEYDPAAVDIPPIHIDTPETRKARARYYTDVTKMDRNLGIVMACLKKHGLLDNTIFLFTSDQGPQWPFAKWSLYDDGMRVPLLVRWPRHVKPGTTDAMVSLCDTVSTLLAAVEAKQPKGLDGTSFLPVLLGKSAKHRDEIYASHTGDGMMNRSPCRCVRTEKYKYILNLAPQIEYTTHMDRATDHDGGREYFPSWIEKAKSGPQAAAVLERYHHHPAEELFDLEADPRELHNLAADPAHAATVERLRARVAEWRKQQGDDRTGPEN